MKQPTTYNRTPLGYSNWKSMILADPEIQKMIEAVKAKGKVKCYGCGGKGRYPCPHCQKYMDCEVCNGSRTIIPERVKRLRATKDEWKQFKSLLSGDARQDFLKIYIALLPKTSELICPTCKGTGFAGGKDRSIQFRCRGCNGTGFSKKPKEN